MKDAANIN